MYHFIVNPCSRTGKAAKVWQELEQVLKQKNVEYRVYFTERPGHATELSAALKAHAMGMYDDICRWREDLAAQ